MTIQTQADQDSPREALRTRVEQLERELASAQLQIRDRERWFQELVQRTAELDAVLESLPDAVYIGDQHGITRVNQLGLDQLGFATAEDLQASIETLVERIQTRDPQTGKRLQPEEVPFSCALAGMPTVREVAISNVATGAELIVRSAARPVADGDRIIGAVAISTDITDWKRITDALARNESQLRLIIDNIPGLISYVGADLKYKFVNKAYEQWFGRPADQIVGQTVRDVLGKEAYDRLESYRGRALGGEPVSFELQYTFPDGLSRNTRVNYLPDRDEAGHVRGFVVVSSDITEQKLAEQERQCAEEALRASELRFRTLADLVPDLLWTSDPNGVTQWCNRRWQSYTGLTFQHSCASGWFDAIHPEDREGSRTRFAQAIQTGEPFEHEHRIRAADGTYRWFLVRAEPLRDADNRIVQWFGAATDVHGHRMAFDARGRELDRTREQLRALAARLIDAQEEERRRLARELHDSVAQRLAFLEMEIVLLSQNLSAPEMSRRLSALQVQTATLTEEVRNLSHDLHPSALEHLGLTVALRNVVEEFEQMHHLAISLDTRELPEGIPPAIATTFYRITQEALRNVHRHGGEEALVKIWGRYSSGTLRLTISDTGRGFNPDEVRVKGGLGIINMQERALLVGGNLTVQSQPGAGTTLNIVVPWVPA